MKFSPGKKSYSAFGGWENTPGCPRCQHSLPRQGHSPPGPPTPLPEAETGAVCAALAYKLHYSASGNSLASVFPGFNHIPGINVAVAARSSSSPSSPGQPSRDCHKRGSQELAQLCTPRAGLCAVALGYTAVSSCERVDDQVGLWMIRLAFIWVSILSQAPGVSGAQPEAQPGFGCQGRNSHSETLGGLKSHQGFHQVFWSPCTGT